MIYVDFSDSDWFPFLGLFRIGLRCPYPGEMSAQGFQNAPLFLFPLHKMKIFIRHCRKKKKKSKCKFPRKGFARVLKMILDKLQEVFFKRKEQWEFSLQRMMRSLLVINSYWRSQMHDNRDFVRVGLVSEMRLFRYNFAIFVG